MGTCVTLDARMSHAARMFLPAWWYWLFGALVFAATAITSVRTSDWEPVGWGLGIALIFLLTGYGRKLLDKYEL